MSEELKPYPKPRVRRGVNELWVCHIDGNIGYGARIPFASSVVSAEAAFEAWEKYAKMLPPHPHTGYAPYKAAV